MTSDALYDLVAQGDLEVAWDLCEERGWFLPCAVQCPQGGLPALQKAGGRRPGRRWRRIATSGGLLAFSTSGFYHATASVWWPGARLW